jgi:ABC-2 type transport system permease protein
MSAVAQRQTVALPRVAPYRSTAWIAFGALMLRDLTVLRKNLVEFVLRTVMQPLLFVFVFTYVFPQIGQGVGGAQGQAEFASILVAGVIAIACIFQGIQAVALPLVQEFGYTREIEDRVMAPLPVWAVAVGKLLAGAVQGLIAAAIVFPLAHWIPITPVHLQIVWVRLLTVLPLASVLGAALGLAIGTRADPRRVPLIFGVVVIPITFLGATYYPWAALHSLPWLQTIVLLNPLVYMSEGMRVSLTPWVQHMSLWGIYGGLIVFTILLGAWGIQGFSKRVLS